MGSFASLRTRYIREPARPAEIGMSVSVRRLQSVRR
jgi:hypothetical protein